MKPKQLWKCLVSLLLFGMAGTANVVAQGYLSDMTTANAVLTRDPARQASTGIDAVITNPAGTALLEDGFHFSVNGIFSYQKIESTINESSSVLHSHDTRILPAVQLAYKKNRWSVSASFYSAGGYGVRKMLDGSGLANNFLAYGVEASDAFNDLNESFKSNIAHMLVVAGLTDQQIPDIKTEDQYALLTNDMSSSLYNWDIRVGGSYKISDNFSAYVGVKVNHVNNSKKIPLGLRITRPSTGQTWNSQDYFKMFDQIISNSDLSEDSKKYLSEVLDAISLEDDIISSIMERSNNGWGVTPVIGLDYKINKFNFGIKYEFESRINVNNSDYHFNVPSVLSFGGNWQTSNRVRLALGSDIIFGTSRNVFNEQGVSCAYDISASCTVDLSKKFLVSGGFTYSHEQRVTPEVTPYILPTLHDLRVSLGVGFSPIKDMQINLGINSDINNSTYTVDYRENQVSIATGKYKFGPRFQVAFGVDYHI